MFCQNCGAKNKDESIFCEACGTKLMKDDMPLASMPVKPIQPERIVPKNRPAPQQEAFSQGQPAPQQQAFSQGQPASQQQAFSQGQPAPQQEAFSQGQPVPQQQVFPQGTGYGGQPVPPAPKKPVSKLAIALVIEAVALIAAGLCLSSVCKNSFSAEKTAEHFFVDVVNGDWESAYSLIDVDESEWINAKMLASARAEDVIGPVSNYRVEKADTERDGETKQLGRNVNVSYRLKGDGSDSTYSVSLIRGEGRKYLLFDDWRVSTDDMLAREYSVTVAKGAAVSFDGVELGERYLSPSADGEDEAYDVYVIPEVFTGTHSLRVSMDGYQPVERQLWIYGDYEYDSVTDLQLSAETIQSLLTLTDTNLQAILSAWKEARPFGEIGVSFTSDPDLLASIREDYEYLLGVDRDELEQVTIHNITADASGSQVVVSFDYQIMYRYEDWWSGDISHETYDGSDQWYFYYAQEDGQWVLTNLGCTYLYY